MRSSEYRNGFGSVARRVVFDHLKALKILSLEERAAYSDGQLGKDRKYLYSKAIGSDPTVSPALLRMLWNLFFKMFLLQKWQGIFRNPLILQVLGHHFSFMAGSLNLPPSLISDILALIPEDLVSHKGVRNKDVCLARGAWAAAATGVSFKPGYWTLQSANCTIHPSS